jgi:hypothetical protein
MTDLRIADNLTLPLEAVTQTFALLAKRGVGKTYTTLVMVEEMLKAGLQVVFADPVGVAWGLRASADGKGPGLPIVVLGGDHGDLPLEVTAGGIIADLIVDQHLSVVLDLSHLRKGEQTRFMETFAETLYHRNRAPLHLVLDEADAFAPQRPMPGQQRMLGAIEDLVRRGRARGIGVTLVTQRPAVLNKDVLTQVEVLVALRLIAPQDRAAIDEWIKVHGTTGEREQLMASLPSLPIGAAWFWSPGWLDLFRRVQVRQRETFDSSATPKVGQKLQAPRALADVDLDQLRARMVSTIEKAKADDPRELRKRIAELERQTATKPSASTVEVEKIIEVPMLDWTLVQQARGLGNALGRLLAQGQNILVDLDAALLEYGARCGVDINEQGPPPAQVPGYKLSTNERQPVPRIAPVPVEHRRPPPSSPAPRPEQPTKLASAERKILTVLAQHRDGATKNKVALLAGYAVGGGGFNNSLSSLRTKGFIEGRGELQATDAGLQALGQWEPLPAGQALLDHWVGTLGKAEGLVLRALTNAYPSTLSKQQVAEVTGYAADGGGFNNALSRLRTLELIEGRGELRVVTALGEALQG